MLNMLKMKKIFIFSAVVYLILFAANDLSAAGFFKSPHFSISSPNSDWREVNEKQYSVMKDPEYVSRDIRSALSSPPIGQGVERFLFFPKEVAQFYNKQKRVSAAISFWPVALWQHIGKDELQLANSARDSLYIAQSPWVKLSKADIRYFTEEVGGRKFYCFSYVVDVDTDFGLRMYKTEVSCFCFAKDLKQRIYMNFSNIDTQSAMKSEELVDIAKDFMASLEFYKVDKDKESLDYAIYSAESLYTGLRQRHILAQRDKETLFHVAKVPINIREGGVLRRRLLKDDFHDIREHPIEERIAQTIDLLKKANLQYKNEARIYYAIGLLSEYNAFGERYGAGFDRSSVEEAYLDAISCSSGFRPASFNLAVLYINEGKIDEGILLLKRILSGKRGEDIEIYCALGYAYEAKADIYSARINYKSALKNFSGIEKKSSREEYNKIKEKIKQLSK